MAKKVTKKAAAKKAAPKTKKVETPVVEVPVEETPAVVEEVVKVEAPVKKKTKPAIKFIY